MRSSTTAESSNRNSSCREVCNSVETDQGCEMFTHRMAKGISEIFYGIKVERIRNPINTCNLLTLRVVFDNHRSMVHALGSIKTKAEPTTAEYNHTVGSKSTFSRYWTAVTNHV